MTTLSENDKLILNAVFNPNLPLTDAYEEDLSDTLQGKEISLIYFFYWYLVKFKIF